MLFFIVINFGLDIAVLQLELQEKPRNFFVESYSNDVTEEWRSKDKWQYLFHVLQST